MKIKPQRGARLIHRGWFERMLRIIVLTFSPVHADAASQANTISQMGRPTCRTVISMT